ncbi:molybdopterin-dependent oxidoreductase [Micrococcales bacterium 31B]|nr:molybdopterin-dependent oxidoreductase [Micrococcales bacterium 31B]
MNSFQASQSGAPSRPRTAKTRRAQAAWAALAGVVAAGITFGLGDVLAYFIAPAGRPVTAVGEGVIKILPAPLIDFAKTTFGTADKPVLIGTIIAIALALAALAGVMALTRRAVGYGIVAVLIAAGVVATVTRADATIGTPFPVLIGGAVGLAVFGYLIRRLVDYGSEVAATQVGGVTSGSAHAGDAETQGTLLAGHAASGMPAAAASRRRFLTAVGVTAAVAAIATVAGQALNAAGAKVAAVREALKLPAPSVPAPPVPAAARMDLPGQSPYFSPNNGFYRIDTSLSPPQIDPAEWTLKITGMVDTPLEITYAELLELPLEEHVVTLACVSNPVGGDLVGNATWLGYPIRELLKRAGVQAGADMVLQTSHDGWTCGTPVEALTDDRPALLAVAMNGEPLPVEHGFPVRSVVPGLYGYVSATKWVTEMRLTTFDRDQGYWTPLGWDALGPIKTQSRIDTPTLSKPPAAGAVTIAGVAWHQGVGISKVEVKVNGGDWVEATLAEELTVNSWLQWKYDTTLEAGLTTVSVRATNKNGETQTEQRSNPDPNGATGWHTVQFTVTA